MSKKTIQSLVIALVVAGSTYAAISYFNKNTKIEGSGDAIAIVNNKKIYQNDINLVLQQNVDLSKVTKQQLELIISQYSIGQTLLEDAYKKNIDKKAKVKKLIKLNKENIIKQAFIEQLIAGSISTEQIKENYKTHIKNLKEQTKGKLEYKTKHILIKSKDRASRLYFSIRKNKSKFAKLARQYSLDQASAQKGGDLGYVLEQNLVKKFARQIKKAKKNIVTRPFKTKFGWHIAMVTKTRKPQIPTFEQLAPQIQQGLQQQILKTYVDGIKTKLNIEILATNLLPEAESNNKQLQGKVSNNIKKQ